MARQATADRPAKLAAEPVVVFESSGAKAVGPSSEFLPLETSYQDDDLVYVVPSGTESGNQPISAVAQQSLKAPPRVLHAPGSEPPKLRLKRALPRPRALSFEVLLQGACGLALLDSGATGSFVSASFCRDHHIPLPSDSSFGVLADGTEFPVLGELHDVEIKLGPVTFRMDLLVAELPGLECVLGMDFLTRFDPQVSWRKRRMMLRWQRRPVLINAHRREPFLPSSDSSVELCTIQEFARTLRILFAQTHHC